jgi:hypothetical protein
MYYNHTNTEDIMSKVIARTVRKSAGKSHIDQFRAGEVWKSPRGERHTVIRVSVGVAYMVNEDTQRKALRACNDFGWGADRPWVRLSSGAEDKS